MSRDRLPQLHATHWRHHILPITLIAIAFF